MHAVTANEGLTHRPRPLSTLGFAKSLRLQRKAQAHHSLIGEMISDDHTEHQGRHEKPWKPAEPVDDHR